MTSQFTVRNTVSKGNKFICINFFKFLGRLVAFALAALAMARVLTFSCSQGRYKSKNKQLKAGEKRTPDRDRRSILETMRMGRNGFNVARHEAVSSIGLRPQQSAW